MDNQSASSSTTAPTLSQVPPIRSFEFDDKAIGNLKTNFNYFRGTASVPIDFVTLPGLAGLNVKISALYNSNIRQAVSNWNVDAPTGILGLGWQMPFEQIIVSKGQSTASVNDTYYFLSNGSANPLVKTGNAYDGAWMFQARNYEFWDIRYYPDSESWKIIKEDGVTYNYGGASAGAIMWAVGWDNWIGSSARQSGQHQYAVGWNLASVESSWGDRVSYEYEQVNIPVGSNDGLTFTQACYVKTIHDSYGRKVTLNYGEKYGARHPSDDGIVEYQAKDAQSPEPNAYQNAYETYFLDYVEVAGEDGEILSVFRFGYDFINLAPTSDPQYQLFWKRCLKSVWQENSAGATLPSMKFEYNAQDDVNPGALKSIIYPEGGVSRFTYKTTFFDAPKSILVDTPIPDGIPRVWHGDDYVILTYQGEGSGLRVLACSWNGRWVQRDVTADGMYAAKIAPDSLQVVTTQNYIAVFFRNPDEQRDELYIYTKDKTQFGQWKLYLGQTILLPLGSASATSSQLATGADFIIAYNRDYLSQAFQVFSYDWTTDSWTTPSLIPSSTDALKATAVAIAASTHYYIVIYYFGDQQLGKFEVFYRELDGSWNSPGSWTDSNLSILYENNSLLFRWSLADSYAVGTYVTGSSSSSIDYSLRVFQWDEQFRLLSDPLIVDMSTPIVDSKPLYQLFNTVASGSLISNSYVQIRNVGPVQMGGNNNWIRQDFFTSPSATSAQFAVADDIAIMAQSTGGGAIDDEALIFNPNVSPDGYWFPANLPQNLQYPTASSNCFTLGDRIYLRGVDGNWNTLPVQMINLGYPESVQNRAPHYIAYQSSDDQSALTYIIKLKNGTASQPFDLSGPQKVYVPQDVTHPGTLLAGPRFIVTYPASQSFDSATSLTLYSLDQDDLQSPIVDFPVAYLEIEDAYDPANSYSESFFYGNSDQSQISYQSAAGLAQYPQVIVVPGVKALDATPPDVQPEGRTEYYFSNGLSPHIALYPVDWIYNYEMILNGYLLAQNEYDADNQQVASQLNYWQVYRLSAATATLLYGGYVRMERSVVVKDGVQQLSVNEYVPTTGLARSMDVSYCDSEGRMKRLRTETTYAWEIPEYSEPFLAQHLLSPVALQTKSILDEAGQQNYIESTAITYKNWSDAVIKGSSLSEIGGNFVETDPKWGDQQSYRWMTPGAQPPSFDFSNPQNRNDWLLLSEIEQRYLPGGAVAEQRDLNGMIQSFIYDRRVRYLVGVFPNASRSGEEASYYGFELYEDEQGWLIGDSASLIPNADFNVTDAHTGRRSVKLDTTPADQYAIKRSFTPRRQDQVYIFSAWVKKPVDFDSSQGQAAWMFSFSKENSPAGESQTIDFPEAKGSWTYMSHRLNLPKSAEGDLAPVTIEIQAINKNTASYVLVDDVRFSPLSCLLEARSYDTRIWQPDALLGPNGECRRTLYSEFQQPVAATNAADQLSTITQGYFSRMGDNEDRFSPQNPNSTLTIQPGLGGRLVNFAAGSQWQDVWHEDTPGMWVVNEQLKLTESGQQGTLALKEPGGAYGYCVGARFSLMEAVTQPLGIRIGKTLTIQWNPNTFQWELLDSQSSIISAIDAPCFVMPDQPFVSELNEGRVSQALQGLFSARNYALHSNLTVGTVAHGEKWVIKSPSAGNAYYLLRDGQQIKIYQLAGNWLLSVRDSVLLFYVAGQRIFSHIATGAITDRPQLFFGNKVAISSLVNGVAPQVSITYRDSAGNNRQAQAQIGARAVVSQTFTDSMGRAAVNTKAAYMSPTEGAPLLAYREDFALFDWGTGQLSGLLAEAYPQDQGYPFSRQVFERSALSRTVERGLPGADFAIGAHSTKLRYGTNDGALGLPPNQFYRQSLIDPNGEETYTITSTLEQVVYKVSIMKPPAPSAEIKNHTIFDDSGCPVEVRSPNYYNPPEQSTPENWATTQTFDYAGRVLSSSAKGQDGQEIVTRFIYDDGGKLRFAQDPEGSVQGNYNYFKYDLLNRVIEEGYVVGQWDEAALRQYAKTDPSWPSALNTWSRKYLYDGSEDDPSGSSIGRLYRVITHNAEQEGLNEGTDVDETFKYDIQGNTVQAGLKVAAYKEGQDYVVGYEYDNLGNITGIAYPANSQDAGLKLHYQYNQLNQVSAISESPNFSARLADLTYLANGRPEQELLNPDTQSSLKRSFKFNSPLWIESVKNERESQAVFTERLSYTEGGAGGEGYYNGTPAAMEYAGVDGDFSVRYAYNSLGALRVANREPHQTENDETISATTYDDNGNFKLLSLNGEERSYLYWPGTQRVRSVQGAMAAQAYSEFEYDKNGNATAASFSQSPWSEARRISLQYDPGTKMTTTLEVSQLEDQRTLDFKYGNNNQRVLKQARRGDEVASKLYIRGTNSYPLVEMTTEADGTEAIVRYIYGPGGLIAMDRGAERYLIVRDHLGSVRAALDHSGAVVAQYDYLTFGKLSRIVEPEPGFLSYLYTGQEFDRETGLYNYRARFYEGELGRFISVDPNNQFFSPYIYAANNPVLYVDPTGRFSIKSIFSAIGGILIGAVEILIGVVIDVVAAVAEVLTGGLSTPVSLALAALSGTFYGAGMSAIGYSIFNFTDFDWNRYGIEMGIGAALGAFTGALGVIGSATAEAATGVKAAVEAGVEVSRTAKAANWAIEAAFTAGGASISAGVGTALSDVSYNVVPGADVGYAFLFGAITGFIDHNVPSPDYKSGWGQLAKRTLVGIATAPVKLPVDALQNVANGDKWDKGLLNSAVSGALWGSLGALQVKPAVKDALDFSYITL